MVIREIKTTGQDLQNLTQILSQTHRSLQSLFPGRKIGYLPHPVMHCILQQCKTPSKCVGLDLWKGISCNVMLGIYAELFCTRPFPAKEFFLRMSVLKVIKKREVNTQRHNDKSQHEQSLMLTKGDPSNLNLSSTMSIYTAMDGSVFINSSQ